MESYSESVLVEAIFLAGELQVLQALFPKHPCREHFRYGRPKLRKFIITQQHDKENAMSATQSSTLTYLGTPSTNFTVAALDQYGQPFIGDLSATTAVSDTPANVGASLGTFSGGQATLTLTQAGGEGTANVTVTNGSISAEIAIESYVPVLTSFTVVLATPPAAPVVA